MQLGPSSSAIYGGSSTFLSSKTQSALLKSTHNQNQIARETLTELQYLREFCFAPIATDRVNYLSDSMRHPGAIGAGRSDRMAFGKPSTNSRFQLRLHSYAALHSAAGAGSSAVLRDSESNVSNTSAHSFVSHTSFMSHTSVLSRGSLSALLAARPPTHQPPPAAMFGGAFATAGGGGSHLSGLLSGSGSGLHQHAPRDHIASSNRKDGSMWSAAKESETGSGIELSPHSLLPEVAASSGQQLPLSLAQVTFQPISSSEAATIAIATATSASASAHSPTLEAASNPLTRVPVAALAAPNSSAAHLTSDSESVQLNSFYKPNISGPSSQSAFRPIAVRPVMPTSGGPLTLLLSPPAPVSSLKLSPELSPASSSDSKVSSERTLARAQNQQSLFSKRPPVAAVALPDATSTGDKSTQQLESQVPMRSPAAAIAEATPSGGVNDPASPAPPIAAPDLQLGGTQGTGSAAAQEQPSARSVLVDTIENSSRTSSVTLSPFFGAHSGGNSQRAPSTELDSSI